MSDSVGLVSHLLNQLAEYSATDESGDHLVMLDSGKNLHVSGLKYVSAQCASAYLHMGEWIQTTYTSCGLPDCVRPDHVVVTQFAAATDNEAEDEQLLGMVQRHTLSLSTLYKRAK